ncbi:MAG: flagellar basal body L-ring protein FlgH [Acidobacteria bacterium]|nr:flagellar basal body L-ring protein FlgH [Acidobacteriota bacterium]
MISRALASVALAALCAACATVPQPTPTVFDGPLPVLEDASQAPALSEGSLYANNGAAELVGDFRARHMGDVLTVQIVETSLGKASADNQLDRSSSTELKAPVILGWENKAKGKLGPDFDPALALSATTEQSFDGQGATTRQSTLSGRIAVRVLAVGAGGRMLVAGKKEILVNRERQIITLAGIVRPEDVGPSNTIASSQIADLTITYGGHGEIADTTKQGWFQRLMAKLWPF